MRWVKKNTKRIIVGFFVPAFLFQAFFVGVGVVQADEVDDGLYINGLGSDPIKDTVQNQTNQNTSSTATPPASSESTNGGWFGWMLDALQGVIVWLLINLRNFIYLILASPAAGAFAWVVDPNNISGPSGVMNLPAVYILWQFIRDFFNLFFILILLFSAFATIFQVDSFNIRNIFKNILLVALLINFSFPITRFLIDAANVPMYYFINDVIGNGTGKGGLTVMENLLGYSGIAAGTQTSLGENNDLVPVLMSVVFAFLFAISLAVLSVMMIIRLVALTLLLIFSPIGFASSLLPGLNRYGQEWWSKFWSYALFGPAAGLMLVVSLKFMEAISSGSTWQSMNQVATGISPGPGQANLITQVIFFIIPIMLIWFTIGLANKFALAGAATVVGLGTWAPRKLQEYGKRAVVRTAKFAGRTAVGTTKAVTRVVLPVDHMKGAYAGVKSAFKEDGKLLGKKVVPDFLIQKKVQENRERQEAIGKGYARGGKAGVDKELEKMTSKRQYEAAEEMKKNNVGTPDLEKALRSGDRVKAGAAAMVLTDRKAIKSAADFGLALDALGKNTKEISELIEKSGDDVLGKLDATQYQKVMSMSGGVVGADPKLMDELNTRIVKEGNVKVLVEHELNTTVAGGVSAATAAQKEAAAENVIKKIKSAKEVVAQESLFADADFLTGAKREIDRQILANPDREVQIRKAAAEAGKNINGLV